MPTKRYDEEQVEKILRTAAEAEVAATAPITRGSGMTLPEIQEIGAEVGIPAERIGAAARALEVPSMQAPVRFLGAQRSVSRTVPIDRPLDDDEWMRLVALLRETFGARGTVESVGPLRTWYNGNLQVHVEPWEGGHRVRMHTLKGNVTELAMGATMFLGMALLTGALIYLKKGVDPGLILSGMFGTVGLGMLGAARLRLPRWASDRTNQMEMLAGRIPLLMEDAAASDTATD